MTELNKEEIKQLFLKQQIDYHIPARYVDCDKSKIKHSIREKLNQATSDKKGIFFTGLAGTGKTYLMYYMLKCIIEQETENSFPQTAEKAFPFDSAKLFRFVDMPWLSMRLKSYVKNEEDPIDNVKDYMHPKYLFLDDLGAEKMTDFLFENFYVILDYRYSHLLPCFISSNYSLKEISEKINDRIASRIAEMCVLVQLDGDDRRILQ